MFGPNVVCGGLPLSNARASGANTLGSNRNEPMAKTKAVQRLKPKKADGRGKRVKATHQKLALFLPRSVRCSILTMLPSMELIGEGTAEW